MINEKKYADIPDDSTNVAASLRDLAANSQEKTGKLLNKVKKLATAGEYHYRFKVPLGDYESVNYKKNPHHYSEKPVITPLVEKLLSLGFRLSADKDVPWYSNNYRYWLIMHW